MNEMNEELPIISPVRCEIEMPEGHTNIFGDYYFQVMSGPIAGYKFVVVDTGEFDEEGKYAIISLSELPEDKEDEYISVANEYVLGLFEMAVERAREEGIEE